MQSRASISKPDAKMLSRKRVTTPPPRVAVIGNLRHCDTGRGDDELLHKD
jgi:hypothetical protein